MKITFISQASVIFETIDATIWTDPWLMGTAFNNSWKLFPKPDFDESWYDKINFLWISHEHPDHFHIPTLKSIPDSFKERVTLLFQDNNSDKMPNAFKRLGFKNIQLLKNRVLHSITAETKIHNFQVGPMDSSLAVLSQGKVALNLNDCEITKNDIKVYKKDLGCIDVVLNQFSNAGYNGYFDYENKLPESSKNVLTTMIQDHIDLAASFTIPIASYIYFCQQDNKFMNDYSNTPSDVKKRFEAQNLDCRFLGINETIDLHNLNAHDNETAFLRLQEQFDNQHDYFEFEKVEIIEIHKVKEAFIERYEQLNKFYPKWILNKLGEVIIYIPDLNKNVKISMADGVFMESEGSEFDLKINSQPLYFSFKFTWGMQTLGVSARFLIRSKEEVWKWYRILTSLNNAGIYLKSKYFFKKSNLAYLWSRINELPQQIRYRLSLMK